MKIILESNLKIKQKFQTQKYQFSSKNQTHEDLCGRIEFPEDPRNFWC